jgi:3'-5' exoribonuclease
MKDFYVAQAAEKENQTVVSYFAVAQKQVRSKRDGGSEYLALTLADKTGAFDARMWENFAEAVPTFTVGDVVKVQALVCRFSDKLQLKIEKLRLASPPEYTRSDFVPTTEKDVDELWAQLTGIVATIADPYLLALARSFLDDPKVQSELREAPAARSMHHAFLGGMLEHVVSMLGLCDAVSAHYPQVHRDLLLIGALLHDIGKLSELSWGNTFDYTMEGTMLGHITIGIGQIDRRIAAIASFPEPLRILVEHMVLSHHGEYEYGSPKLPMIPEAVLLHYIDNMDAKMQTMDVEFRKAAAAGKDASELTDWVRSMDRPLLNTRAYLAAAMQPHGSLELSSRPERSEAEEPASSPTITHTIESA